MRVHGRRRREADRLPDVTHGRRVAVLLAIALDVVEDLPLPLGEVQLDHPDPPAKPFRLPDPNMCSQSTPGGGRHQADAREARNPALYWAPPRACGGIGRRARLRALSCVNGVGVRVSLGASSQALTVIRTATSGLSTSGPICPTSTSWTARAKTCSF